MFEDISKVIIVSDMDGTLLDSNKKISEKNISAIKKFTDLGGHFTIATGRTIESFRPYAEMLDIKEPIIMFNGAMIYDSLENKILYSVFLPESASDIAIEILENVSEIGGEVLKVDGTWVFENNEYEALHTKICKITPHYAKMKDIEKGDWLKVLFATSPDNLEKLVDFIQKKGYNEVSFVKSSEIFCEMLTPNSNKGQAIAMYRELDGMQDYTFVSIGDFNNDIEMLIESDLGAVPSNAIIEAKEVADLVLESSCDESAVAELIEIVIKNCKTIEKN